MRFEHDAPDDEEPPITETGNRWYFFIPLLMLALWLLVTVARAVAATVAPSGASRSPEAANLLHDALELIDWIGILGWLLLFPFYLVVLANKRASPWWSLGGLCCGANLPLYVVLLFLPTRRRRMSATDALAFLPIGTESRPRPSAYLLQDSFVCDHCGAILNFGVSECRECGHRFRYDDGNPPQRE